jgi:hypothetical protein
MESVHEARTALAMAERAGAAPYIDYPPTPRWYPPVVGAWGALIAIAAGISADHAALGAALILALIASECAFLIWYRRYRRVMPSMTGAPREIAAAFRRFVVGAVVVLGACAGVYAWLGPVPAAVFTFCLVTPAIALYERDYAAAAAAARARLQRPAST